MDGTISWIGRLGLEDLVRLHTTPQTDLLNQGNVCQNPYCLYCKNGQTAPKIYMELQGSQNRQNNLEKEQSRRHHTSLCQNLLQRHRDQKSVVLT